MCLVSFNLYASKLPSTGGAKLYVFREWKYNGSINKREINSTHSKNSNKNQPDLMRNCFMIHYFRTENK
jgi:hypothetical protein